MALCKDEAIVLLKRIYGESDRIIHLFTVKSGKVAAIAKGANKSRKRFINTLEPFNHIRVEYFEKYGRGMARIDNADIVEANDGIETGIKKACMASFFTEFVDRLTKAKEPNRRLFEILRECIGTAKSTDPTYADVIYYQLLMLDVLGYHPNFETCVYCGTDMKEMEKIHFSRERGGVLCPICARSLPHRVCKGEAIPGILAAKNRCGGFESAAPRKEAQAIMEGFMAYHIDVDFKSYRLLKSLVF